MALPAPELDSSTISAPVIGRQTPKSKLANVESSLLDHDLALGAGEGIVVTTTKQDVHTTDTTIALTEKPSSTFLTDLTEHNSDDNQHPGIVVMLFRLIIPNQMIFELSQKFKNQSVIQLNLNVTLSTV